MSHAESVAFLQALHAGRFDAELNSSVRIIPYEGKLLGEVRRIDFLKAFGQSPEVSRIVAFGRCNMQCPYCYRDAQFVDAEYNVHGSVEVKLGAVITSITAALQLGETIRLSGGDPSLYAKASDFIARYVTACGGRVSYCHNGSAPGYVRRLLPFTSNAAIDVKSLDQQDFIHRTGVTEKVARVFMSNSLQCVETLVTAGVPTEVRTTVFGDTRMDDLENIAEQISRRAGDLPLFWTLRNYDAVPGIDWSPMPVRTVLNTSERLSKFHPTLFIGYRRNWVDGRLRYVHAGLHHLA